MSDQARLGQVFVELADTLTDDFDVIDFLHLLTERVVELLEVAAAGLLLVDSSGRLRTLASSLEQTGLLQLQELLELQNDEGPALDCFRDGLAVVNVAPADAADRWPGFSAALAAAGYGSAHALPLSLRSRVIGAVTLFSTPASVLSEQDTLLGQALADVATIGLLQEQTVRRHELTTERLQQALDSRILIEQAKGALAARLGIEVADAFTLLRAHSRRSRRKLADVAHEVVAGQIHPEAFLSE